MSFLGKYNLLFEQFALRTGFQGNLYLKTKVPLYICECVCVYGNRHRQGKKPLDVKS